MARRGRADGDDIMFGSDSFLDVMANLIGIIIILIVITALRIKQAPAVVDTKPVPEMELTEAQREALLREQEHLKQWERDLLRIEAENARRRQEHEAALAARAAALAALEEKNQRLNLEQQRYQEALAARNRENDERQHLLRAYEAEAAAMIAETAELQRLIAEADREKKQMADEREKIVAEIATKEEDVRQLSTLLDQDIGRYAKAKASWEEIGKQILEVREQLAALQAKPKPTVKWVHYSSPISRQAQLQEVHFRCMNGKVASIHLEALLERVVDRLTSGGSSVPQLSGVVGPINGFRLEYRAMITGVSLTEQLNNPFMSRLQLSSWEVGGASDDLGETYEQAVGKSSDMLRSLWSRPADQFAITMWVYPNSFELARSLRIFLHERGYNVALRPLPFGQPIAGSRHGTASFVQ